MKLVSIQHLRAIAVLLVLHCHAIDLQMKFGNSYQQDFFYLENFGAVGVDIFFVVSGFIISYITQNSFGKESALAFTKKRFIRINPSYYFTSMFVLVIYLINGEHFIKPLIKTLTILPIFDFGKEFWFSFLFLGWTLSFEWFFYIIYALLIYFSVKKKNKFLFIILGLLSIVGVLFPIKEIRYIFITNPIILEFSFGIIIAHFYKKISLPKYLSIALLTIGILIFCLNIALGYGKISEANLILNGQYCWQRVLYWGVPSSLIVAGSIFMEKSIFGYKDRFKLLTIIGDASFSIYLTHYIIFLGIESLFRSSEIAMSWINQDILIILLMAIAIFFGVIYYKFVEKFLIEKTSKIILRNGN